MAQDKIVLVDMDSVIADFEGGFLKKWRAKHPDKYHIPLNERTTFALIEQYPPELIELVRGIYYAPRFFLELEPISGSIDALHQMKEAGINIFFCTSPLRHYEHCVVEKYQWIDQHFGPEWTEQIILTRDKTAIRGDILIDDKPHIIGAYTPTWEHVLYHQPYNQQINSKKRLRNWQDWQNVIFPL